MLMKITFLFLVSIHLSLPAGLKHPVKHKNELVPRVVNGWPATIGDAPYQISFKLLRDRARLIYANTCGGVLIGPAKVVSAAHCFHPGRDLVFLNKLGCATDCVEVSERTTGERFVVAGSLQNKIKFNESGQWRTIGKMFYPADYGYMTHDIAVGYVDKPFNLNSDVAPIAYATKYRDYVGSCLISGFGFTEKGYSVPTPSPVLLLAHLEIINTYQCSKNYKRRMRDFVCTSDKISRTGPGDSGGPLVCSGTGDVKESRYGILVGVVSGAHEFGGGFSTRISSHIDFLDTCKGSTIQYSVLFVFTCLCLLHYSSL